MKHFASARRRGIKVMGFISGMRNSIYGECVGADKRAPVAIARLSECGCHLQEAEPGVAIPGVAIPGKGRERELELWIGAVGPIHAVAKPVGRGTYAAHFRHPIDRRIVHHFNQA